MWNKKAALKKENRINGKVVIRDRSGDKVLVDGMYVGVRQFSDSGVMATWYHLDFLDRQNMQIRRDRCVPCHQDTPVTIAPYS